jgi:sugar phosphate permease
MDKMVNCSPSSAKTDCSPLRRLPGTVLVLGVASFFTDFSSEMIYPLLPVFLSGVLGAGPVVLGAVEGVAEATAAFVKIISGWWTDRIRRRKPFVVAGYGLAGLARPLIGLASSWLFVLAMRFLDRMGKGLRTSPRDALITDVTPIEIRGRAFGYYQAIIGIAALPASLLFGTVWHAYGAAAAFGMGALLAALAVVLLGLVPVDAAGRPSFLVKNSTEPGGRL